MSTDPKSDRMKLFNYFNFCIDPLTMGQDEKGKPNHQSLFANVGYLLTKDPKFNSMVSDLSFAFTDKEDKYTFYAKFSRDNAFLLYQWLKKVFEKEGLKNPYAGNFRLDNYEVLK